MCPVRIGHVLHRWYRMPDMPAWRATKLALCRYILPTLFVDKRIRVQQQWADLSELPLRDAAKQQRNGLHTLRITWAGPGQFVGGGMHYL